jgi:hypothetical protein
MLNGYSRSGFGASPGLKPRQVEPLLGGKLIFELDDLDGYQTISLEIRIGPWVPQPQAV